jgi:hypothetical protein
MSKNPITDCITEFPTNSSYSSEEMNFINENYIIDSHCKLLESCINDVNRNAKSYHISFMMRTINKGKLDDIKNLNGVNLLLALRLFAERRKGHFNDVFSLSRVGMTSSMINTLIHNNS